MTFEELTPWDLDLIRSNGSQMMAFTRCSDRYEAIARCTLSCLHAKGYDFLASVPHKDFVKFIANCIVPKHKYGTTQTNPSVNELIEAVFTAFKTERITLTRSNRESTWSTPKPSWYANDVTHKKPWMF